MIVVEAEQERLVDASDPHLSLIEKGTRRRAASAFPSSHVIHPIAPDQIHVCIQEYKTSSKIQKGERTH